MSIFRFGLVYLKVKYVLVVKDGQGEDFEKPTGFNVAINLSDGHDLSIDSFIRILRRKLFFITPMEAIDILRKIFETLSPYLKFGRTEEYLRNYSKLTRELNKLLDAEIEFIKYFRKDFE